MAISRIQQSQISGSLSYADNLDIGSGLAGKTKLSDDLNALRSLVKDIKGSSNWYDAASQDLAEIYAAMRASGAAASFMGNVEVLTGSITASGNVHAGLGYGQDNGGVSMYDGGNLSMDGNLQVDGNADIDGIIDVAGVATFQSAITGSAGLKLAGDLDVNSSADFQGAVNLQSTLAVASVADFNGGVTANEIKIDGDVAGRLYIVGASGEIDDSSALSFVGGHLSVTGSAAFTGALSAASAAVAGAFSAVSGTFSGPVSAGSLSVSGASTLAAVGASSLSVSGAGSLGSLTVSGATALNGGLTMDTNKFVVADGTGNTLIGGTLGVAGAATLSSTLAVTGGASLMSSLGVMGPTSFANATNASNALQVTGSSGLSVTSGATVGGALSVSGASTFGGIVDANAGLSASLIKIDGATAQRLYIVGSNGELKDESKLVFDGSDLSVTGGLRVSGNAQVDGDLLVKGAFTYIETENMKVKDAFIYLATGSNGSVDSGIVLSKGAGAAWDLIVGQDGGAGELVFAKVAHNSAGDSPADLNGAALVPAWISEVKLGGVEGTLSGSLKWDASGIKLESVSAAVALSAAGDLSFSANGNSAISFADAAQAPTGFTASTVVGMLNELKQASQGGNLSKQSYSLSSAGVWTGDVLSFAGQGTLASADHKCVDVFLNGVLLAPGYDLVGITTTSVTLESSIKSSLINDDVITVVIRA